LCTYRVIQEIHPTRIGVARRPEGVGALSCTDYGAMRVVPTNYELERFVACGNLSPLSAELC
jgi:hypothetical protein